jgi:hypothetical protein
MPRATRAGFAWASAAPILVLVACGGRAIEASPSVANDAANAAGGGSGAMSAGGGGSGGAGAVDASDAADAGGGGGVAEAGVDAGGRDAPALPGDAGLAEILYGRTFTYWALRKWDRHAYPVPSAGVPIPEDHYVPIAPAPHYIVRFSADGLSTTLTPVPDGGAPPESLSCERKTASDVSATYGEGQYSWPGVFVVSIGSGLPAAKVTIKGSGEPVVFATAGELRD